MVLFKISDRPFYIGLSPPFPLHRFLYEIIVAGRFSLFSFTDEKNLNLTSIVVIMDSVFNSIASEYQLLGPVRNKLEEFENGGFTLKKHQLYAVRRNLNMQQSTVIWNL